MLLSMLISGSETRHGISLAGQPTLRDEKKPPSGGFLHLHGE
ncbi:MAG: hypothetical protein ACM35F_00785 [Betaproteobacteria bacterium]|jgi:hypothetical protein